jgi:hypothetical protein
MKPSDQEYNLSHGKPHVFKMTLDDGFACYQYDITLNVIGPYLASKAHLENS